MLGPSLAHFFFFRCLFVVFSKTGELSTEEVIEEIQSLEENSDDWQQLRRCVKGWMQVLESRISQVQEPCGTGLPRNSENP